MNIELMGQKVSEVLALQGKVDSTIEQCDTLKAQISANNSEIRKLQSIQKTNEASENKLKALGKELDELVSELQSRLAALEKDGIKLPLGNQKQVVPGRL